MRNAIRIVLLGLGLMTGCMAPLRPRQIEVDQYHLSSELMDGSVQIQRGKPRKILDTVGWVIGIPSKIILWNRRIDNHSISAETESAIGQYLASNGMATTRVRLNQYAPREDWRRLVQNKRVGAGWRYTLGAVNTLYETVLPGRLIGGDHYNPFTDTIHLYSDVPAIALHEAGHAKDFARRKWKGTYAAAYLIPGVPLYHESLASGDALAYAQMELSEERNKEAIHVLYPAYGTYVGSTLGYAAPRYADPLYYGSVVAGHVWGRLKARNLVLPQRGQPSWLTGESTNPIDSSWTVPSPGEVPATDIQAAPLFDYHPAAELGTRGSEAASNDRSSSRINP